MTNTIRHPFGGDQALGTLKKFAAASTGKVNRTITNAFSFLRCATAVHSKTLRLVIADSVPVGAILLINAQSAGSSMLLATGFAGRTHINTATKAAHGTGDFNASFIYNGTAFYSLGVPALKTKQVK
jgi:hypothetical protein